MNRITIFHYHLLPGGVTNVILLGIKALVRHSPEIKFIRLVCGKTENTDKIRNEIKREIRTAGRAETDPVFEISVMTEISYTDFSGKISAQDIKSFAAELLNRYGDSFWWIHNYQLGKNPLFTAAVAHIAGTRTAQKMLLHIHDFPECARFENLNKLFAAGITDPYPDTENSAYALINGRDTELLKSSGIPEDRIFLLNNPLEDEESEAPEIDVRQSRILKSGLYSYYRDEFPGIVPEGKLLFYPIRIIRRKNVLEAGLAAAISEQPVNLAVSLPGVSKQESNYSETCRQCFHEGIIPGIWGSGIDSSPSVPAYPQMLKICDMIISSSVQEGFGYLFINAVQSGAPLFARDLDILNRIRGIFPEDGSFFYDSVHVPINRTDTESLTVRYRNKLESLRGYLSAAAMERLSDAVDKLVSDGKADYSYLPVEMQIDVLCRIKSSDNYRREIHSLNQKSMSKFYGLLNYGHYAPGIGGLEIFSLKAHSERITEIMKFLYGKSDVSAEGPGPVRSGTDSVQQKLLESFAELKYMRLLYDY